MGLSAAVEDPPSAAQAVGTYLDSIGPEGRTDAQLQALRSTSERLELPFIISLASSYPQPSDFFSH